MHEYKRTHPWITFEFNFNDLGEQTWLLLGEAASKLEHVAGTPLMPALADELNQIYLSKGVHATTEIEGNSLSEDEVRRRIDHQLPLPDSQEYLGQEIDNIIRAYNRIIETVANEHDLTLNARTVCDFNAQVLDGLDYAAAKNPGQLRTDSVVVGTAYRGAPAEDCEYLLDRLCEWLEELHTVTWEPTAVRIVTAILAHLYLAWIHPFGDGNGRTARLVEFQLLVRAKAPTISAHLLADFYNRTRTEYYRQLGATSQGRFDVTPFIAYAVRGLVDGLREQIDEIRVQQFRIAWRDFIHESFRSEPDTGTRGRRRLVALAMPWDWTPRSEITKLTPDIAVKYNGLGRKALSQDINHLKKLGLIVEEKRGTSSYVRANAGILSAFMPLLANEQLD